MKNMRSGLLACLAVFFACAVRAEALPASVTEALAAAQIPLENVSIVVRELGARDASVSVNADKPMNPASVVKLVTTYAGLELLGPAFTWKTEVLVTGEVRAGKLNGDLVLRGFGDPKLSVERFWMLLKQLRDRGLVTIGGDLVLDRGYFQAAAYDPAKFDGEPLKPYNVGPDPLLLNFKTVRFFFSPALDDKSVAIAPDVRPAQLEIVNRVKLTDGNCGEWRERIAADIQAPVPTKLKITFTGNYPRRCNERAWNLSLLDHPRYVGGVFAGIWRELGGIWNNSVKLGPAPANARLVTTLESPPLAEVIRDINKYSNNVMARQLFLTLSSEISREPGSVAASSQVVREWLTRKNIAAPELQLDNGSGLSRNERLSAATLTQVLDAAWRSSVMPEFMSSLSVAGSDGTMRQRGRNEAVAGKAHIKTGTLADVRAMAGYVIDAQGKRWSVVMLINHPNAGVAQAAQDALLNVVYNGSPGGVAAR